MFDFVEVKAKLLDSAFVLDRQLNNVVFPVLAIPMIPHFKLMIVDFPQK